LGGPDNQGTFEKRLFHEKLGRLLGKALEGWWKGGSMSSCSPFLFVGFRKGKSGAGSSAPPLEKEKGGNIGLENQRGKGGDSWGGSRVRSHEI